MVMLGWQLRRSASTLSVDVEPKIDQLEVRLKTWIGANTIFQTAANNLLRPYKTGYLRDSGILISTHSGRSQAKKNRPKAAFYLNE
jgi:hypothetical protein